MELAFKVIPEEAYERAIKSGRRCPNLEPMIKTSPYYSFLYALNVIGGRWPEGEDIISRHSQAAYDYARCIIKGRWPEGEAAINLRSLNK